MFFQLGGEQIRLGKQLVNSQFPQGELLLYWDDSFQFSKTKGVCVISALNLFQFSYQFTKVSIGLLQRIILIISVV